MENIKNVEIGVRLKLCRAEYDRTMKLFLLKEYSEWVYCAGASGDYEMTYYQKYYEKSKKLARELGF